MLSEHVGEMLCQHVGEMLCQHVGEMLCQHVGEMLCQHVNLKQSKILVKFFKCTFLQKLFLEIISLIIFNTMSLINYYGMVNTCKAQKKF